MSARTIYGRPLLEFLQRPRCTWGTEDFTFEVICSNAWHVEFISKEQEWQRLALDNPAGAWKRPIQQLRWGRNHLGFTVPFTVVPKNGDKMDAVHRAAMACFCYDNYPGTWRQNELTRTDESQGYWPWTDSEISFDNYIRKHWD